MFLVVECPDSLTNPQLLKKGSGVSDVSIGFLVY